MNLGFVLPSAKSDKHVLKAPSNFVWQQLSSTSLKKTLKKQ
jgi:hypothetical protein